MPHKISVVIPTKDGGELFLEVLEGLKSQSLAGTFELLVIDSGSSDNTISFAKSFGAKVMEIAPCDFNHGATRNLGISNASGDIVVMMTQDAVPGDEYLVENLVKPFADPTVAGSYARQVPRTDADVLTKRNLNGWLTGKTAPEVRWITSSLSYSSMSPMEQYLFCNFDNVCSAVRKDVLADIPFNACYFGEDIDWSKRALEAGWKIAYQPSSYVIHSHSRPISYEYKRTYMCHRKLYELFKLRTIPEKKYITRSFLVSCKNDIMYILTHESNFLKLVVLLFKIPLLCFASAYGQYRGAHDEKRLSGVTLDGV